MSSPFEEIQPPPFALARERRAWPNGMWAMVLFVCAEVTLFGTLIATYFYLDFSAPHWPPLGIERPSVGPPAAATAMLVFASVPIALAARAALSGARRPAVLLLAGAMAIQCGYLAWQIVLFSEDLGRFGPQGSAYGSAYFTLLAAHHAHVLLGILFDLALLWWLLRSGLTDYRLTGVRATALYWHVVNALAVLVLLTQLSPSL